MKDSLLQVSNLTASYGKIVALSGISLALPKGSIVTVIGSNGAGKSTLLNSLAGLMPSQGEVVFEGRNISLLDTESRVELGMVIVPETRELFSSMSVDDNLKLGAFLLRRDPAHVARRMRFVLELFPKLGQRANQMAGTLSGGERQMLAVARALMIEPKLLMLDEPSLGLAPLVVNDVIKTIAQLKEVGVSVLLVEQNAKAALKIADYGYVLETGDVSLEGTGEELANNPRIVETYLGLGGVSSSIDESASPL